MAGTTQYKNDWQKANLDRIRLTVPKGRKELIQDYVSAHGESVIGFINHAICEAMERTQIFEQSREEIITITQKYNVDINDNMVKKLAEAFAVLEPQIPNIEKLYFSTLKSTDDSSEVEVYTRVGNKFYKST